MDLLSKTIGFNSAGIHVVAGTSAVTAADANCSDFRAIKALGGDVVISAITGAAATGDTLAGRTISNGDTLIVRFSGITLTSGVAVLTKNGLNA